MLSLGSRACSMDLYVFVLERREEVLGSRVSSPGSRERVLEPKASSQEPRAFSLGPQASSLGPMASSLANAEHIRRYPGRSPVESPRSSAATTRARKRDEPGASKEAERSDRAVPRASRMTPRSCRPGELWPRSRSHGPVFGNGERGNPRVRRPRRDPITVARPRCGRCRSRWSHPRG
jgi:hypothetical protein